MQISPELRKPSIYLALIAALALAPLSAQAEPVNFAEVRGIFAAKCLACHGNDPRELKGDYDLRSRASALRGGETGEAAIVPGQPEKSPLYRAITWKDDALQMPPKENDRLSAEQVELVRRWIAEGANWNDSPAAQSTGGLTIKTSGGQSPDWDARTYEPDAVWAYQPISRPEVPALPAAAKTVHPIDAFLLAKLQEKGIAGLAPPADRSTLLRRLSFDLTGLPPTPTEIGAFLADESPAAFSSALRRLLASPNYGERMAQHWLDVVRYADTGGFSNDFERPHAWRYRDYVIRGFNADKPLDRFLVEQLAGDELDPNDPEMLIATGYLRMGPWEHTGMTVAAITRQQFLDDVTHHVGVSLLGQGLRCAACHDHKFDPLPTRDYYRMQALFAPVQFAERPAPFLPTENTSGFAAAKAQVQARIDQLAKAQAALKRKNQEAVATFLAEKGVKSLADLPASERPQQDQVDGTFGLSKTELSLRKIYQKSQAYLERELQRGEPFAMSVYSGPPNGYTSLKPLYDLPKKLDGTIPVVHILPGGSLESPADPVSPGLLSAMFATRPEPAIPAEAAGRRLALARWITSRDNTLTARVLVNRVWQMHFGRGLVATSNNFGKMGSRPTHPELLDWLATWLIEHGWSLKELHELILSSAAWQQASERPDMDAVRRLDPRGELLASFAPRRLSAEEIRDAQLAVSGELNRTPGGPGVFPEIHWEVALQPRHIMGSVAPAYLPSPTPDQRHRRTIYAFRIRTLADPHLEVLNRPGSETSCDRRDETTVTPQVFALFSSEAAAHRALALAARLTKECRDDRERASAAFELVYGRPATAAESQRCLEHLARMTEHHRAYPPTPTELPRTIRRGMVEELTGEMVHWDEDLSVLAEYQRDLLPWEVDPATRAWADLCLVLFNSNEFLYVR
ncbi:MAG: PSD1 and planctomycete cytochrome C domain-containing protein [Pirellulaceae bacterium]|nr:PSD1 and planctomycete cytochrome C domain-containing protein [Pirellulaceae bacterium]